MRVFWVTLCLLIVLALGRRPAQSTASVQATPAATSAVTTAPTAAATADPAIASRILNLKGDFVPAHDPAIIKAQGHYYLYNTGPGIPFRCADSLNEWTFCGSVFNKNPAWIADSIPGVQDLWAPDISFFNSKYHLYYAASTFGSNHSAIGLATNVTLDPQSADYKWVDEGQVIGSQPGDNYNAIDPNLAFDEKGQTWLAFGSFWSGIKMRKIDPTTGKLTSDDTALYALASRPSNTAIEGPFIVRRSDYFYLFVSWDFCCKGVDSTYKIAVGRAKSITGPYVDRDGKEMRSGGGSLVYTGSSRWRGPGHNAILIEGDTYWLVYHSYDAKFRGIAELRIEALEWDADGWPVSPSALLSDLPQQ